MTLLSKSKLENISTYLFRLYFRVTFPSCPATFNVSKGMFVITVLQHSTELQKQYWLPKINNFEVIGTYAQTELGHGTFVRVGKTVNYCVLMAQLYTKNKCHGVHPFMVPLRSLIDHKTLPGVELGDIGNKQGFTNVTNGYLKLTNHRIPREYMLMRYARVEEDGTYVAPPNKTLTYGTMVHLRVNIMVVSATLLSRALHALTTSLKAFSSSLALEGVEECRMACGGHGYSHARWVFG
ncbi:hypothetical protein KUTeg_000156 [Tegillarca granosa]|uniref:Acyl-CoA oxidase C-alpha1 domain-containing protein n=1 Tax=Tegillarca granosa TaxID=220873 RepID=A0ABQ9FZJ5_TEGGR|nr:hypothetical protein KUTeg_000156 [Tegillarca granosa]